MTTISQLPATVNLHFVQGDTFARRLHFTMPDESDYDISSWTIRAQIREYPYDEPSIQFGVVLVTDGTDGLADIAIGPNQTSALPDVGVWDLERADENDAVQTLLSGSVTVDREVTR